MSADLALLPALDQAALVRSGEISPVELVELSLERIQDLDLSVNAFVTVRAEEALADARAAQSAPDTPFRGVPIGIKDLTITAGIRTTYSCRAFADHVPDEDAAVVRRLREAGFVIVGKTNTPEFGTMAFTESDLNGACRNPWALDRTTGGSSGGAAAAVAAGMIPVAHGTDGGGSIRIPASCCGLFGLKPSRGRVSAAPFSPLEGLSTAGPIARTVADAAALLDEMAGYEPGDLWHAPAPERPFLAEVGRDPGKLRVALCLEPPLEADVDPSCAAAAREAGTLLGELGHDVVEAQAPWHEPDLLETFLVVWQVGPAIFPVPDPALLTPLNRALVERALTFSAVDYGAAVMRLHALARRVIAFVESFDLVLTPTLALPPVPIGWLDDEPDPIDRLGATFTPYTAICNLTGLPAVSVPLAWSADGLPLGIQVIGRPFAEATLLRVSSQLELARPWADRIAPLATGEASGPADRATNASR